MIFLSITELDKTDGDRNMKKAYISPVMECETFIPNEYIANCYNYEGIFHCYDGELNQNNHGYPCSKVEVKIVDGNATGHEAGSEKANVWIYNVNYGRNDISQAQKGDILYGISWSSDDIVNHTGKYNHKGWAEITSQVAISSSKPNAS